MKKCSLRNGRLLLPHRPFPASNFSSSFQTTRTNPQLPPADARLKGLCGRGRLEEALLEMGYLGGQMKCRGYDALLTECMNRGALREGRRVHAHMIKVRYLPPVYLANRVIVMYVRCGELGGGRRMLEEMTERSVVSWTTVISGCSQRGHSNLALDLFVKMIREGIVWYALVLYLGSRG